MSLNLYLSPGLNPDASLLSKMQTFISNEFHNIIKGRRASGIGVDRSELLGVKVG